MNNFAVRLEELESSQTIDEIIFECLEEHDPMLGEGIIDTAKEKIGNVKKQISEIYNSVKSKIDNKIKINLKEFFFSKNIVRFITIMLINGIEIAAIITILYGFIALAISITITFTFGAAIAGGTAGVIGTMLGGFVGLGAGIYISKKVYTTVVDPAIDNITMFGKSVAKFFNESAFKYNLDKLLKLAKDNPFLMKQYEKTGYDKLAIMDLFKQHGVTF